MRIRTQLLEYDSNLTHLQIRQHFLDKKRGTALTLSGFKVSSLTAEQAGQFHVVHKIMFSDPIYDLVSEGAVL